MTSHQSVIFFCFPTHFSVIEFEIIEFECDLNSQNKHLSVILRDLIMTRL